MEAITVDMRLWHNSGIGVYLQNLIPRLVAADERRRWKLIGDPEVLRVQPWSGRANVSLVPCTAPIYSLRQHWEVPWRARHGRGVFWSPHYDVPFASRGKLLVTIHDLLHVARPEFLRGQHRRLYARGMFHSVSQRAAAIVCDSQFTADEIVSRVGADPERITVVHLGVDLSWFTVPAAERPYPKPYLLFIGNVKPHKNLTGLLQAFASLTDRIPHDLIIVGSRSEFITGDQRALRFAADLRDRVQLTGFVEENLLRQYVRHADALILPSFYEGFGLPALEAMACGTPVIAARAAALPEVCGDAALYCDPHRPADIAAKIRLLVRDPVLVQSLRDRGRERARQFTWERCAAATSGLLDTVIAA